MLVDQYLTNGVEVTFFGRKTKANPMLARLLRQVDCPIHGMRIIRLPNHRFRAELSEEVKPVRDANGTDRHSGHDAGGHQRGRRLGARISGAVAVAAPPVAVTGRRHSRAWCWRIHHRNDAARHFPVFTLVHSRLMMRWVAGSRAVMTNSFFSVASSG